MQWQYSIPIYVPIRYVFMFREYKICHYYIVGSHALDNTLLNIKWEELIYTSSLTKISKTWQGLTKLERYSAWIQKSLKGH